jgi:hypothetical protein
VHAETAIALLLALASTTLTNVAYLREHDAAAALPALSLRRPLHSAQALLSDRSWLVGFALESGGFALYVVALALAPLTLVQSISAGGIGILAFISARAERRSQRQPSRSRSGDDSARWRPPKASPEGSSSRSVTSRSRSPLREGLERRSRSG